MFVNRKAKLPINSETIRSRFTQLRCEVAVVTVAESAPTTDYVHACENNIYWTGKILETFIVNLLFLFRVLRQ